MGFDQGRACEYFIEVIVSDNGKRRSCTHVRSLAGLASPSFLENGNFVTDAHIYIHSQFSEAVAFCSSSRTSIIPSAKNSLAEQKAVDAL